MFIKQNYNNNENSAERCKGKKMKKYIRTESGDFWELKEVGYYHKPDCASVVPAYAEYITASADEIYQLIKPGDLVQFRAGHARVMEDKDILNDGYVSSMLKIKAVYTQCEPYGTFTVQAIDFNGLWIIK